MLAKCHESGKTSHLESHNKDAVLFLPYQLGLGAMQACEPYQSHSMQYSKSLVGCWLSMWHHLPQAQ